MSFKFKIIVGFFMLIGHHVLLSQTINFGSSGLVGANIANPTSLDFGPNNKLYVAQQDGIIWEYEVTRDAAAPGNGTYSIVNSNQISLIKSSTPNHNDDGTFNSTQARQITGLLAAGTALNPVLYVTSSDSRIGGGGGAGNDVNLDTNSGILSRLRWDGSTWVKTDLVRGLPRCEENHSTNGLDMFIRGGITYLFVQQGGNTNQGSPSNNFAGTSEFYLSGALLIINITQLEQMETANSAPYLDPRTGNTPYIYDLPTLNDPERSDIDNSHPSFPYGPSHPLYNAVIDLGDPFGGNNGLNQAFPENGGPVQIFSPGYRNAYDVMVTSDGRIFTGDNGPNGGWGGTPLIYDINDQLKGTHYSTTYDAAAGDYVTNEFNIENGISHGDALHYVGTINDANNTYYAGHPVPIRAFPEKAGVHKYQYSGSNWVETASHNWSNLISGVKGYFNPTGFTMADFPNDTRQGEYLADAALSPEVNILDIVDSSTNGLCEYTASNFGGAMQGNILTASFDGSINRYLLNADGTTLLSKDNAFLTGFGNIPLDLVALGDNSEYPGTIWVATYGANDITIFEPADLLNCISPEDPEYDANADYDGDGYTNLDETNNGTNPCSAGSKPNDFDGDFISDLTDPDDDNDGIVDNQDAFAIDAQNGLATNLPIVYPFWNNDPGTGFFGLGFTGLQLDPSGNTDYLTQFDPQKLSFGGAGGKATVDEVSSGDALNTQNSQENAFQFGIDVDSNSSPFTIYSRIATPFNGVAPLPTQSYGIFIGTGDQDNYLKVALMDGISSDDGVYGLEVVLENNGNSTIATFDAPGLLQASGVDLYITVNPGSNSAEIFYSLNSGLNINPLGSYILPANFLDANDNKGLAIGITGTSGSSGSVFNATWDFIIITENEASALASLVTPLDFGQAPITSSNNTLNLEIKNLGNPSDGPIQITQINIVGSNADLFSSNLVLPISVGPASVSLIPITFNPNEIVGVKTASVEIVHNGTNSPLIVPLTAELTNSIPVVRISAGSATNIPNTDGGPDWESNPSDGVYNGISYSVNSGITFETSFSYENRDSSIPPYIDQNTFNGLFNSERFDLDTDPEMDFSIPVANGDYTVNLYLGNGFSGTSQPGERVFDILLEGVVVQDNLDLITTFGHEVAGMLSFPVTVNDGILNVSFGHVTENPLINAIEVILESLSDTMDGVLVATPESLDFGFKPLNGAPDQLNLNIFNPGNIGEDITVTAMAITGVDANLFSHAETLPLTIIGQNSQVVPITFTPNGNAGIKTASLEITHSGDNSPLIVPLTAELIDFIPVVRISAGSANNVVSTDGGPDWESNPSDGMYEGSSYSVNTGITFETSFSYENRDSSIPAYIDQNTFNGLFNSERFDLDTEPEMDFSIPISNGNYTVNLYLGNGFSGTSQPGDRVFDILLEGVVVEDNLDLITTFGHEVAGMLSFPVTVNDGVLNISFGHEVENPLINAIEIIGLTQGSCQWNDLASSSLEKVEAQSAKVGDKLYVLAGFLTDLQITGATEIYNSATDVWTMGAPMPIPVTHMGVTVVGTDIWVVSGFVGSHPGIATDKVQIYDTVSNSWSFGPDLPVSRGSGAVTYNNGKIHYFGGLLPDRVTDVGEHYVLDVNNQGLGWIPAAALPHPRNHLSAASVNGLVYAIGGQFGHDGVVQDQSFLEVYDPSTDMWTELANLPSARSHFEPGTLVHNGKIIIVGGRQADIFYNDVTEYNPTTDEWSERCELPENLLAPAAKVFGDRLIVANGGVDGTCCPSNQTRWIAIEPEFAPLVLNPIADQFNQVGETSTLVIAASGGDPNANITYSMSGQPAGLIVEPTNGQITGSINVSALTGGPNNDGIHLVTVTVSKPGSMDVTQQFTWTITSDFDNLWFDKNEDESYTARHECSFVQAGDKFYMFGGRENAQTMDIYDYTSNTWTSLVNSAPEEFNHFQAVEYQGLIWVIGAFKTNDFPSEVPADYIWSFNPATQEWIQGPEIPASRKRGSTGLVVYNDKFYILAGNTMGHDGGYVSWFDEYNPATGIWTQLADAPRARDHFHSAIINGKLYAASGRLSGGPGGVFEPVISEVDVYDFATSSWSTLPSAQNIPTPRAGAVVVNFENKLIVAGGESPVSTDAFDITEIYDPVTQSWSVGAQLNHQRQGTQGIVSGNGIFVAGGSPVLGGGNQKNMEFYGQDNPFGSASIASSLSADPSVNFEIGETKTITITNSGGNIGTLLDNFTIDGPDASLFTINSGNVPFKLMAPNTTHDIIVTYIGSDVDRHATLTVSYNNSSSVTIDLDVPIILSTENPYLKSLKVFNDFQNQSIVISGIITEPSIAKLYDVLGREVLANSLVLNTNVQHIPVDGLSKGVYIIRIESATEKMTKKLIIK